MDNSNGSNGFRQPRDQLSSLSNYASNGKIMLFSGIILFAAILIVLLFHSSARWLLYLPRRQARRRFILSLSDRLSAGALAAKQGLDPSILKALPVLVYSSETNSPTLECAVCLSEFQDGEEGRVLPACKHTFHSCCIDMWFRSHANCPLCRSPVQIGNCKVSEDTVIPVIETVDLRQKEENDRFCSASMPPGSLSPLQCEKITPDLVAILVEVPTSSGPGQQILSGFSGKCSGPSFQVGLKPNGEKIGIDL